MFTDNIDFSKIITVYGVSNHFEKSFYFILLNCKFTVSKLCSIFCEMDGQHSKTRITKEALLFRLLVLVYSNIQ